MIEYEKISERNNLASHNNNFNNEKTKRNTYTIYTKNKFIRKGKYSIKQETKIKTKEYFPNN